MSQGKILFIDAYDSFTNNIISLLRRELSVTVEVIHIDDARFVLNDDAFREFLKQFDGVVSGPGPGDPSNPRDVGLIAKIWSLSELHVLPVLGICLGFQSLALACGAAVGRLKEPRHGLVTRITHCGHDIFEGVGEVDATQYHSLQVHLRKGDQSILRPQQLWQSSTSCKQLIPLAWDLSDHVNGPILMSVKHCHKPYVGVQYHPESICTNRQGRTLVVNWWRQVCEWNLASRSGRTFHVDHVNGSLAQHKNFPKALFDAKPTKAVLSTAVPVSQEFDVADLVADLRGRVNCVEPILLGSGTRHGTPTNPETGRFSIIGLHDPASTHIRYSCGTHNLSVSSGRKTESIRNSSVEDLFAFIDQYLSDHKFASGPPGIPFWGGLVGFLSYEAGLESIGVTTSPAPIPSGTDAWFIFVERSIVLDHATGVAYVQSIRQSDADWMASMTALLAQGQRGCKARATDLSKSMEPAIPDSAPEKERYCTKVSKCQSHLRAGSSYELCLTDQTTVQCAEDPWQLYLRLRKLNPAPFGAYMRFAHDQDPACSVSIVSSSPERFLSWSREGTCQFRPIKGTVKKGPGMTRAKAEAVLASAKEKAENLMIVDLIRHDLAGVAGYVFSLGFP